MLFHPADCFDKWYDLSWPDPYFYFILGPLAHILARKSAKIIVLSEHRIGQAMITGTHHREQSLPACAERIDYRRELPLPKATYTGSFRQT